MIMYLFFFFESFLNIEEEGETGSGGLKWRVVTRGWLGGSCNKGDSNGESKNVDEVSLVGEYAGGSGAGGFLGGNSTFVIAGIIVSSSLLLWLDGVSPSSGFLMFFSSCSDITNFFTIDVCSFKWY